MATRDMQSRIAVYGIESTATTSGTTYSFFTAGIDTQGFSRRTVFALDFSAALDSNDVVTYAIEDSPDASTWTALASDKYLPVRKQTGNTVVPVSSDGFSQTFGAWSHDRYVRCSVTTSTFSGTPTLTVIPILVSDLMEFDDWDSTQTGSGV